MVFGILRAALERRSETQRDRDASQAQVDAMLRRLNEAKGPTAANQIQEARDTFTGMWRRPAAQRPRDSFSEIFDQ